MHTSMVFGGLSSSARALDAVLPLALVLGHVLSPFIYCNAIWSHIIN